MIHGWMAFVTAIRVDTTVIEENRRIGRSYADPLVRKLSLEKENCSDGLPDRLENQLELLCGSRFIKP